jgi:hypothetical protein
VLNLSGERRPICPQRVKALSSASMWPGWRSFSAANDRLNEVLFAIVIARVRRLSQRHGKCRRSAAASVASFRTELPVPTYRHAVASLA